jgi:hypothetical protein
MVKKLGYIFQPIAQERHQGPAGARKEKKTSVTNELSAQPSVSSGLGKALAEEALSQGWRVAGTVWKEADRQTFEAIRPGCAIGRILDIRASTAIRKVIADLETAMGG